ncbi:bifunctional tetrahydrofolate synthase/dihydrofolate synthase [Glaesserella parasuis]|uniref:bifunctional tetrahydrofolate synthase/dihydrofolate synthase n=1 Tax=Glaesserella parasuis TaxID=738 RepID=UPI000DD421D9|nr:bifunctional tetrahydrofolate synthase/dihydrofolate synthase [Glaesserella parasuis]MDG6282235.1 bifunctional tetrahydrofolate synthase/dihydrofolate synthase [Glaesserella parasuis]MDG6284065.1 bifunctional tetrahydrofolate synthase/dihydrofolate synthase [Glaesserella parasuis]MDG6288256.1 bifunctional tetrahydrofolate synthase/dihydrofolate synthase [Glaesserella parasuis]MDO9923914.1 bifunctional tetrahydrofolate synthase/dihydrofolate synthase [Glaesserella parasuis]MDO9939077.1 bifun
MNTLISPKATDSLETWLSYLEKSHFKPIDMGLERIRKVAEELDLLKPAPYVITVAGTNGKGSTCKLLEMALLKAGLKVGVYSSPHLIHYNERVRIQGQAVGNADLIATFDYIEQHKSASLTYFEFGTLAALDLFRKAKVDVAILEVGLGGRLDATNIVDPDFAVITSIDIDHVEFLGDNREAIGREKAGIFRPNIPVVIGESDCPQSILDHAKELQCHVFRRDIDWKFSVESDRLQWQSKTKSLTVPLPKIPQPNCATALAVLTQLPFELSDEILVQAVEEAQMTARFQLLGEQDFATFSQNRPLAQVIIDVGHNPHAARYLADRLAEWIQPNRKIYAVFSALVDKDLSGIVEPLEELIDEWHCAGLQGYRGQSGAEVKNKLLTALPNAKAVAYENVIEASQVLFETANEQDIILVFGSFHTVADFVMWIEQ